MAGTHPESWLRAIEYWLSVQRRTATDDYTILSSHCRGNHLWSDFALYLSPICVPFCRADVCRGWEARGTRRYSCNQHAGGQDVGRVCSLLRSGTLRGNTILMPGALWLACCRLTCQIAAAKGSLQVIATRVRG